MNAEPWVDVWGGGRSPLEFAPLPPPGDLKVPLRSFSCCGSCTRDRHGGYCSGGCPYELEARALQHTHTPRPRTRRKPLLRLLTRKDET